MLLLQLLAFLTLWGCGLTLQPSPTVQITNGVIMGVRRKSSDGYVFNAYLGIPYALPPVGNLRFEPPKVYNLKYKNNLWKADQYAPQCVCYDNLWADIDMNNFKQYAALGSEDCLYLNVFTPVSGVTTPKEGLPVIVYIHGGGFGFGAAKQFLPDYIMNKNDVVVVTINYRLGAFGFMSTGTAAFPGNMGLKDQVMALKWIQKYIKNFGGNPGSVTLSGMSAGGASTHLAYLSPMTDGLFHRGYSYSGSALVPWGMWGDIPEKTEEVAKMLNCPIENDVFMMDCLSSRPALAIAGAQRSLQKFMFNPFTVFGPTVEPTDQNYYLNSTPYEIIASGKAKNLPYITAYTQEDGLYGAAEFIGKYNLLQHLSANMAELLPLLMFYNHTLPPNELNTVTDRLIQSYLKNDLPITFKNFRNLLNMMTDRLYGVPCLLSSILMSKQNKNVYMYYFRYRGYSSITDSFDKTIDYGVGHADDSAFVFHIPHTEMRVTQRDIAMSDFLIDILVNFAKTGKPIQELRWTPFNYYETGTYDYFEIRLPTDYSMKHSLNIGSLQNHSVIFANERFSEDLPLLLHPKSAPRPDKRG